MSEQSYHATTLAAPHHAAHTVRTVHEQLSTIETAELPQRYSLLVTSGARNRVLWAMDVRPMQDRAIGETGFVAIESYYPRDHHPNTWIYGDVQAVRAPVQRTYWLDTDRKPGRLAGFVTSRFRDVIEQIQVQDRAQRQTMGRRATDLEI